MEKSEEKIINQLTSEFNLHPEQVTNTVKLIDDGTQFLSLPVTEKRQQAL